MSSALSLPETMRPAAGLGLQHGLLPCLTPALQTRRPRATVAAFRRWAAWEKCYYPAYDADVSALAGALQLMAMGTRPGVAVAVAALVLGRVPVSAAVALHLLGQAAGAVLQHVS